MYMLTFITTLLNILWAGNFTNVPCLPRFWGWAKRRWEEREKSCEMRVVYVTYPHLLMQSSAVILFPAIWDPSRDSSWLQKNLICKKNKEKGRLVKITSQLSLKWSDSLGKTVGGNLNKHANVIRFE